MAKFKKRTNSSKSAIMSILETIGKVAQAELGEHTTPEAKAEANKAGLEAVAGLTAMVKDSNLVTMAELADIGIEQVHEIAAIAEQAEAEQLVQQQAANETEQRELVELQATIDARQTELVTRQTELTTRQTELAPADGIETVVTDIEQAQKDVQNQVTAE
jgi:hypothetical protein